jgi:hypothetical protein
MPADRQPVQATTASLVERIERAAGPSRELDADIARAVGWQDVHGSPLDDGFMGGRPPGGSNWLHVPGFSGSIDAALSLVPPGAGLKLDRYWLMSLASATEDRGPEHGRVWSALITWGISGQSAASEDRPGAALAVCAAALRARMEAADAE